MLAFQLFSQLDFAGYMKFMPGQLIKSIATIAPSVKTILLRFACIAIRYCVTTPPLTILQVETSSFKRAHLFEASNFQSALPTLLKNIGKINHLEPSFAILSPLAR